MNIYIFTGILISIIIISIILQGFKKNKIEHFIACSLHGWSDKTSCDPNNGTKQQERKIKVNGTGLTLCAAANDPTRLKTVSCDVDCTLNGWTDKTSCDPNTGTKQQERTINIQKKNNGKCAADNDPTRLKTVNCDIDCQVSGWGEWTNCSTLCGGGTKTRTRTVTTEKKNNGASCPVLTESGSCNEQPCPVDCQVSSWGDWSSCDKECGGGTKTRTRTVTRESAHGGQTCPTLTESGSCNTQPCPVDCQVSGWGEWTNCSTSCGGGTKTRTRTVTRESAHGGQTCPTLTESGSCNTQTCPVDCQVSGWGEWTNCSTSCGSGTKTRTRTITTPSANGGQACPILTDLASCNTQPCPVDCQVSSWGDWTNCSTSCGGGTKTRTRTITTPSAHGGQTCPTLTESGSCNTQPCPVDCQVSGWGEWTNCSTSCGGGTKTRTRTITTPSANSGQACPVLTESGSCNTQPCPVDCQVSGWGEWTNCSTSCGGGTKTRTRTVTRESANGGQACPTLTETGSCNTQPCPVDCQVSSWGDWTNCSTSCGGGTKTRTRTVTRESANGGQTCPILTETGSCNTQPCPVDCQVSGWGEWTNCSTSCGGGTKTRTRSITRQSANGGQTCPILTETGSCNSQPCPVDCQVSSWGSWTACSAPCINGKGVQTRSRIITTQPANGGAICPILNETNSCETQSCNPVNCQVSNWNDWTQCSSECGGGTQSRSRTITTQAANGGQMCPILNELQQCNTQSCPIDCKVSEWSEWTNCNSQCGGGVQTRSRTIITHPTIDGQSCPILSESKQCNQQPCIVDCQVSEWTSWTNCSSECGGGTQTRSRNINIPSANGGKECPILSESQSCNNQACIIVNNTNNTTNPVNCEVSNWSEWTKCSSECGGGTQTRSRRITTQPINGGNACPILSETRSCNEQACPVDCQVSPWSEWTNCDSECGGGKQTRSRSITISAANGGKECPLLSETKQCNEQYCPINCEVTSWTDWSDCSNNCGGGVQIRSRTVSTQPAYGGQSCPTLLESKQCNEQPCPVDCIVSDWTEWTNCNKNCGGGTKIRTRNIIQQPQNGGNACPILTETEKCNEQPCPIDCKLTDWTTWSNCDRKCGGGIQTRTRKIISPEAYGGNKCPTNLIDRQICNQQSCPKDCSVSEWSKWSNCDKPCGTGNKTRSRYIITPPDNDGKKCPTNLIENKQCNTTSCSLQSSSIYLKSLQQDLIKKIFSK